MRKQKEDLINFVLVLVLFSGVAAAGATILAAEINQIFTYISARLANYTTHNRSIDHWAGAGADLRLGESLCDMRA